MIATSTPEMKKMKESSQKTTARSQKTSVTKKLFDDSDSDISLTDILEADRENENGCDGVYDALVLTAVVDVKVDDYVVCEFSTKTSHFYYVGVVLKERDEEDDVEVDFFRRKGKKSPHFVKPAVEDISSVHIDSIRAILPPPTFRGTTARTKGDICFQVDFGGLDLR